MSDSEIWKSFRCSNRATAVSNRNHRAANVQAATNAKRDWEPTNTIVKRDPEAIKRGFDATNTNVKRDFVEWDTMGVASAAVRQLFLGSARHWTSTSLSLQVAYNTHALYTTMFGEIEAKTARVCSATAGHGSIAIGMATVFNHLTVSESSLPILQDLRSNMRVLFGNKVTVTHKHYNMPSANIVVVEPQWSEQGLQGLAGLAVGYLNNDNMTKLVVCAVPAKLALPELSQHLYAHGCSLLLLDCKNKPPRNIATDALTRLSDQEYFDTHRNRKYNGPVRFLYVCRHADLVKVCAAGPAVYTHSINAGPAVYDTHNINAVAESVLKEVGKNKVTAQNGMRPTKGRLWPTAVNTTFCMLTPDVSLYIDTSTLLVCQQVWRMTQGAVSDATNEYVHPQLRVQEVAMQLRRAYLQCYQRPVLQHDAILFCKCVMAAIGQQDVGEKAFQESCVKIYHAFQSTSITVPNEERTTSNTVPNSLPNINQRSAPPASVSHTDRDGPSGSCRSAAISTNQAARLLALAEKHSSKLNADMLIEHREDVLDWLHQHPIAEVADELFCDVLLQHPIAEVADERLPTIALDVTEHKENGLDWLRDFDVTEHEENGLDWLPKFTTNVV